jgi:hypothetical protein
MIAQQFSYKISFSLFERDVVGVAAKNVLEFAFKFVYIIVMFSSEFKLHCLFAFGKRTLL